MRKLIVTIILSLSIAQLAIAAPPDTTADEFVDGKPTVTVEAAASVESGVVFGEDPPGSPVSEAIIEPESEDEEIIRLLEEL